MENRFRVELVNNSNIDDWRFLCDRSPQSTPFIRKDYLECLGYTTSEYVLYCDDEIYMGICIPLDKKNGKPSSCVEFAPYQGMLYLNEQDCYRDYHNNLEATSYLLDYLYLESGLGQIAFSNSYKVKDFRPVQWHHYHSVNEGVYSIGIRWTSIIKSNCDYSLTMSSTNRRRDYKYSKERYGIKIEESTDIDNFIALYKMTFLRQGIELNSDTINKVVNVVNLGLEKNFGRLIYAVDPFGNKIDALYILTEHKKSYYLFGANDPNARKKGGATLLFMNELMNMKDMCVDEFDFIGVNSPNRGDFKLSFGGDIYPYYTCSIKYH